MKKIILGLLIVSAFMSDYTLAQDKISNSGSVEFLSLTKKDVKATCQSLTSKINLEKKTIVVSVPIQGFVFEASMMQKKFNGEKVMNSKEYPKAKYKGDIKSDEDITKEGTHKVKVDGEMTMKGVTKPFSAEGEIVVSSSGVKITSSFVVNSYDYGIEMKYGKELQITLTIQY